VPAALWKAFEDAPFGGDPVAGRLELDPSRGVPEGNYTAGTALAEAAAYGDMVWIMMTHGIGAKVVSLVGTPDQIEKWSGGMARGQYKFSAFGLTEPGSGSDAAALRTSAKRDGDTWVINGSKMFCTGGALADWIVVFATIDPSLGHKGIRAFIVERGTPGFSVGKENEHKLGVRALCTSELVFDNVVVPLENCLGSSDTQANAFHTALNTLNTTRQQVASMAVGIAQAALDEGTMLLSSERASFSQPRWTRIQDELVAMGRALQCARLMARRAAWRIDHGLPYGREASMAKAFAPPLAEKVILRVLQMLGPDGWSEEHLIEKWYRDVKIMDIWEGPGQIHRRAVARHLFGHQAA
jgi:alkylation response protein AidB-like acyl-CoA dehydrogenase